MEIKKAKDIMIPLNEYPHIPHTYTLCQALAQLEKAEFDVGGRKSLPRVVLVFNENNELLGKARRRDILSGLDPESLASLMLPKLLDRKRKAPEDVLDKIVDKIKERLKLPVTDVMHPIKESVDHEDDIIRIINKIVDSDTSFLPVLKDNEVVGVVRTVELLSELADLCHVDK